LTFVVDANKGDIADVPVAYCGIFASKVVVLVIIDAEPRGFRNAFDENHRGKMSIRHFISENCGVVLHVGS
jgi:hypothetical protein